MKFKRASEVTDTSETYEIGRFAILNARSTVGQMVVELTLYPTGTTKEVKASSIEMCDVDVTIETTPRKTMFMALIPMPVIARIDEEADEIYIEG